VALFAIYGEIFFFFFFAVLGFELRAFTLSHSTTLFVLGVFEIGSCKLFAWAGFVRDPPDLCLLSSYDYRCEPPVPSPVHGEIVKKYSTGTTMMPHQAQKEWDQLTLNQNLQNYQPKLTLCLHKLAISVALLQSRDAD
jgi:hypothetical protein